MTKARSKNLLIVSFSELANDARLLKQIALFKDKYRVTTCGYGPTVPSVAQHVEIPEEAVYWHRDRKALLARRYKKAYWSSPAVRFAFDALRDQEFDAIIANDVDTAGLAVALDPKSGFHADLHEYSPREAEHKWWWRAFIAPYVRWQIRKYVTKAASVTTVGEGIAREYSRKFGLPARVVENATPYWDLQPTPVHEPLAFVYSGAGRQDRYLEVIIEAFGKISSPATLDMYLVGSDKEYVKSLEPLLRQAPAVRIRSPRPYKELIKTLNQYDVGIHLLPPVNFNHRWALPNKVFDYVQARLGIVVGPSPEMARLVKKNALGKVTEGYEAQDLAKALETLSNEDVQRFKSASDKAAKTLSAETAALGWEQAIEALLG